MVVSTGVAVYTALSGAKGAKEGAAVGASIGGAAAGVSGTIASVGGASTGGTAAGAIVGASLKDATPASAATGAFAAGTGGFGVSMSGYAGWTLAAAGITTGGLGYLALGMGQDSSDHGKITYDCWKPVVHEMSEKPSDGMLLKDLVYHPHVAKYTMTQDGDAGLPYIVVENIWEEKFEIQYFVLHDSGKLVGHVNPLTA